MGNRQSDNFILSLLRHLKSGDDSEWRVGTLILLGALLYYFSMIVVLIVMSEWSGWPAESTGYLMGFVLIICAPIHMLGLLVCIRLISRLKWLGVVLAAVGGALYVPLFLMIMDFLRS